MKKILLLPLILLACSKQRVCTCKVNSRIIVAGATTTQNINGQNVTTTAPSTVVTNQYNATTTYTHVTKKYAKNACGNRVETTSFGNSITYSECKLN